MYGVCGIGVSIGVVLEWCGIGVSIGVVGVVWCWSDVVLE